MNFTTFFGILLLISCAFANHCTNPSINDVKYHTTSDARLNLETVYVVQFRVKCANNAKNVPFFTEVNGNFLVSSADESGEKYQLSWTETHKAAKTGDIKLKIFDEDGYSALKKAQRNNEDLSKVKEIQTISVYHKGATTGPYFQSELLAILLFGGIFYWAQSTRNDIQA